MVWSWASVFMTSECNYRTARLWFYCRSNHWVGAWFTKCRPVSFLFPFLISFNVQIQLMLGKGRCFARSLTTYTFQPIPDSSAGLGWPGNDRDCYLMHRMQSGGWSLEASWKHRHSVQLSFLQRMLLWVIVIVMCVREWSLDTTLDSCLLCGSL